MEAKTSVGLVIGHAYGITAVRKVNLKGTSLLVFLKRYFIFKMYEFTLLIVLKCTGEEKAKQSI